MKIQVDGLADCGRRFEAIAFIHEIDSENPGLEIPKPLGANAVAEILRFIGNKKGN